MSLDTVGQRNTEEMEHNYCQDCSLLHYLIITAIGNIVQVKWWH